MVSIYGCFFGALSFSRDLPNLPREGAVRWGKKGDRGERRSVVLWLDAAVVGMGI